MDGRTRPEHRAWHDTILPSDDPWWDTHYPPNGWGCRCTVVSLSESEMKRNGLEVSKRPEDGTYEWTNPATGEVENIPKGIDPGWGYNPGEAAWGEELSKKAMDGWDAQGAAAWERLTPGGWGTYDRPERIPLDSPAASLGRKIPALEIEAEIKKLLGAEEKVYSFQAGDFRYGILVNAKNLAAHIDPARDEYLPFLPETLLNPYEVWLSFERHKGAGKVVLRQRIIKAIKTGKKEGMLAVTNAVNGFMEAWTFIPVGSEEYLNKQRVGKLIWKR